MIKRNEGLNRVQKIAIISTMITTATIGSCCLTSSYVEYNNKKHWKEFSDSVDNMRPELEKLEKKAKFEQEVKKKIEENRKIMEQIRKEEERKERERKKKLEELSNLSGLEVVGFTEYTFEISFYSDLNCENGWGNITAYGETLSDGMIANNFLPKDTMVYFDGYGTKRVADTGSDKYFNAVNKADVFVPRQRGEDPDEYFRRVNNMGRKHVKGYILEVKNNEKSKEE